MFLYRSRGKTSPRLVLVVGNGLAKGWGSEFWVTCFVSNEALGCTFIGKL